MGPSRYDHLIFCLFSPDGASCMRRGCVAKKRNHRGNASRENLSVATSPSLGIKPNKRFISLTARLARQESSRVISTARLRTLPPVHLPPINVVVCNDPNGRSYLEVGFVLRCFQHLSVPDAATRPCPWRDNRLAGGRSNTVLSY